MSCSPEHRSRDRRASHGPAAYFVFATLIAVLFSGAIALSANVPRQADQAIWTRLKIKAAFVSRETTLKHRDAFSAPEFGWRILASSGAVLARSSLYGNLYYPADPANPADRSNPTNPADTEGQGGVRLQLIERDIFQDDSVAVVPLRPGVNRYEFGSTGDYVELERSRFEPDRESGADARPAGAVRMRGHTLAGTVDFRGADYTDYIQLPRESGAVLILRENISLHWDLPGLLSVADVLAQRFPSPESDSSNSSGLLVSPRRPSSAILLHFDRAAGSPRLLRLRAPIGGGQYRYRLFAAPATKPPANESAALHESRSDDATRALLEVWLGFLRARNAQSLRARQAGDPAAAVASNSIRRGNLAETLLDRDAPGTTAVCRKRLAFQSERAAEFKSGSGRDLERVFCAHLLYEHADAADVDALLDRFARESEFYQEALRYVNQRAERNRSKQ